MSSGFTNSTSLTPARNSTHYVGLLTIGVSLWLISLLAVIGLYVLLFKSATIVFSETSSNSSKESISYRSQEEVEKLNSPAGVVIIPLDQQ